MRYKRIREVELELNTICQSFCPVCIRYIVAPDENGDDVLFQNPGVKYNQVVDIENIRRLFSSPLLDKWENIDVNMIGTAGEPVAHPQFIEIVKLITELCPYAIFNIHTNGGVKNQKFFTELGEILTPRSKVCFSFDGVDQKSNEIYRIGVDWDKAIKNMKAFIDAGGEATWQFIIFDHNRHLEQQAREMAMDMGCRGFDSRENVSPDAIKFATDAANYKIDMKTKAKPRKKPMGWRPPLPDYDYIDNQCFSKDGIFLAPDGKIWPCCMMPSVQADPSMVNIWNEATEPEKYGNQWNNLELQSLTEIMSHPWWDQLYKWTTMETKPCDLCVKECGASDDNRRHSDINEISTILK